MSRLNELADGKESTCAQIRDVKCPFDQVDELLPVATASVGGH